MYCCSEATYLCNMGTLHLCKSCKQKPEYHRKFNTQCRGGAECPLGLPHPRAGSMTPFPLSCGLCKSDQANLLNSSIEVYSSARMTNLLNQTIADAAGPISQTRKRALSTINVNKDRENQAKKDFMKRKLAVKALQAKLDQ